jgi:hypothetical protein
MQLSLLFALVLPALTAAFVGVVQPSTLSPLSKSNCNSASPSPRQPETKLFDGDGTGGWGIGTSRKLTPEEFLGSDRAYFDGYQMSQQGDFRRTIEEDKANFRTLEMEELMGVAKSAGINMKNPKDRLNKFEFFDDDDEDELDLSV